MSRAAKPNILFIMTDQQSANMMSVAGTPWLHTPALDRLAAQGTRFDNAICTNPVCVPSRMSMASGFMPGRIGACDNPDGMVAVIPDHVAQNSLGLLMKRAGYDTFYGGKIHMCAQLDPRNAGYDAYFANERDTLPDACINFFSETRQNPFFAVASFINPHDICFAHTAKTGNTPQKQNVIELYQQAQELPDEALPPLPANYAVPDVEPEGMFKRRCYQCVTPSGTMYETYTERDWRIYRWIYARLTEGVDRNIGRILNALDQCGRAEDTVVIFASDHGNMHANHGLASKGVFYEESVRVPFNMRLPGVIPAGEVSGRLVSTGLDILPTCCDYAGTEVPAGCLGISQRGAAEGSSDAPAHDVVFSENIRARMLRGPRWKYTVYDGNEPREVLSDLENDPGELRNLAGVPEYADTLAECRERLRVWFEQSGDDTGLANYCLAENSCPQ